MASDVHRLRRAAPGVPITVWDYADYRQNQRHLIEAMTGLRKLSLPSIADPISTRTSDAQAIAMTEAIQAPMPPRERARRIAMIYEATSGPRFELFSEAEAKSLIRLHYSQMRRIASIQNVRLLEFK